MKRNWDTIRLILEKVEDETLEKYINSDDYVLEGVSENDMACHVEMLIDAGIIRNADATRDITGEIVRFRVKDAFITMHGHDLLDALRDKTVWHLIKKKASSAAVSLSWEFIKAAFPAVIAELLKR